jgi:sigma-54 specific flagellar transcriptional regulator A
LLLLGRRWLEADLLNDTSSFEDELSGVAVAPSLNKTSETAPRVPELSEQGLDLKEHLAQLEVQLIRQALDATGGVVAHAAKLLKMRRTTLVEKLKKYGMEEADDEV